jgi:hypothetical protein
VLAQESGLLRHKKAEAPGGITAEFTPHHFKPPIPAPSPGGMGRNYEGNLLRPEGGVGKERYGEADPFCRRRRRQNKDRNISRRIGYH